MFPAGVPKVRPPRPSPPKPRKPEERPTRSLPVFSKYLMNDIPRGTPRTKIINSLLLPTPASYDSTHATAPDVHVGIIMANSRLDDELSVATIELSDTPEWLQFLNEDPYGFPKKTAFGTLWRDVDRMAIDQVGQTAFMRAVIKGGLSLLHAEMMAEFEDTDVNVQDSKGRTALHWACAMDHFDMVRLCLSVSESMIGMTDNDGLTAFDVAHQSGNEMIPTLFYKNILEMEATHPQEALLRALTVTSDPAVGRVIFPGTAMFQPVRDGNIPLVEALIARGIDQTAKNEHGYTALHLAAEAGHIEIATMLLDAGYDLKSEENSGATPLDFAAEIGNKDMERALLGWEVKLNAARKTDATRTQMRRRSSHVEPRDRSTDIEEPLALQMVTKPILDPTPIRRIERRNMHGRTELLQAALDGNLDIVNALLLLGANMEAKDTHKYTALHLAAKHGHREIVKVLLARGANIEAIDGLNTSPLLLAARNGHNEIVTALIQGGASIEGSHYWNQTALQGAACYGHTDVVTTLLAAGANIEATDSYYFTALHRAADHGHTETVIQLLSQGAETEVTAAVMEYTPLHLAAASGRTETFKALLAYGARVEALCAEGTPLQMASKYGRWDIVELLVASPLDRVRHSIAAKRQ